MTLTAGAKLDSYEVLGLLGAGGMGEVYRARDPVLKREVAIKVLPAFVWNDPDRLRRFEQEAQAAAALNHPNILAVHQFGVFEGAPYLVSELLEGSTLRQVVQRGPMPVRKAIDYGVQIAHGLAAAHEKGIVHRDLKTWSPDGNYLSYTSLLPTLQLQIIDVRTGKKSAPPLSKHGLGYWVDQDTLVAASEKLTNFQTFSLKTQKWSDLGPKIVGRILIWMISPDGKYLYFTTGGAEPKAERIRFADQQVETITNLKDLHRVVNHENTEINVAPDGSPIFTRDTGYQEIYALNIKWP